MSSTLPRIRGHRRLQIRPREWVMQETGADIQVEAAKRRSEMPLTVAEIMSKIPAAFVPEEAIGMDAVVHFKFTGDEAGEWNAVVRDGRCEVARGIPRSKPSVSLTADSSDFVRIVLGEMDGMKAVMEGRLKVTGDVLLAPRLIRAFRVPGA